MFKTREYHRRPPADLDGLAVFRRAKFSPEGPLGGGGPVQVGDLIKTAMTGDSGARFGALISLVEKTEETRGKNREKPEIFKGLFDQLFTIPLPADKTREQILGLATAHIGEEEAFMVLRRNLGHVEAFKIAVKAGMPGTALNMLFRYLGEIETYKILAQAIAHDEVARLARTSFGDMRAFRGLAYAIGNENAFNAFLKTEITRSTPTDGVLTSFFTRKIEADAHDTVIEIAALALSQMAVFEPPSIRKQKPMERAVLEAKLRAFFGLKAAPEHNLLLFDSSLLMKTNEELVSSLLERGYADKRIAEAMREADRKAFVPQNYWPEAYQDHPLPIGFEQTISAPGVVAFMSKSLNVREGLSVLEIGAGSGWQAAVLGFLVGKQGYVTSIERVPELVLRANESIRKLGLENVEVIQGDGTLGYPEKAPFDRIMVTAAGPQIPPPLLEQLAEGGKLIMPVGGSFVQDLILATKRKGKIDTSSIMSVVFVPLIGKHGYREGI